MAFRNPLGSDTALSLAANPAALPAILTVAGVTLTVGAITWSYHAYHAYQEKKQREEVEAINRLHKKFLEKIVIPEYNEIQGFPPIFKLTVNDKTTSIESMHFTLEQINDVGKTMPRGVDIALYKYREIILNAILELKSYYIDREEPNDITAGVISYLLHILETKCLNFAGFEYDIAYLLALAKFINAYASLDGTKNSPHFSRLSPVYGYLNDAIQELQKHKEALSLKEMIGELSNCCVSASKKMIKTFVKLITPEKRWKHIGTATHDELAKGLLRRKYVNTQIWGVPLVSDGAVEISDSNFKIWLSWLLKYFEESINPDSPMTVNDILSPERIFYVPDLNKLKNTNKKNNDNRNSETDEAILKSIRKVFHECENYLTMKVDPKTTYDSPRFIHVNETEEIIERAKVIASLAKLTHQIISLQYLCVYLLKSIKQLGEIYVKNPLHFSLIFNVVDGLCNQIAHSIDGHKKAITLIQQANNNAMQLEAQELFPEQTIEMLDTAFATISKLGKRVKEYRDKIAKNQTTLVGETESVKHEMFEVADTLARIYNIKPDNLDATLSSEHHLESPKPVVASSSKIEPSSDIHSLPRQTFWQRHKYKIYAAIAIGGALLCTLLALLITFFSGGTLSPVGAMLVGLGIKVGLAGAALVGLDVTLGLSVGFITGSIVGGAVALTESVTQYFSSHRLINKELKKNNKKEPHLDETKDITEQNKAIVTYKPLKKSFWDQPSLTSHSVIEDPKRRLIL